MLAGAAFADEEAAELVLALLAGRAALSAVALAKADALAEDGFLLRDFIAAVEESGSGGVDIQC